MTELSRTTELASGDLATVWKTSEGDYRGLPTSALLSYLQDNLTFSNTEFTAQYSAPSATGFSVSIVDGSASIWLILTPAAGYAAGTIVLPAVANCEDNQEILVNCTQDITTLTINGNGATAVTGEPSGITANDYFRLKYNLLTQTWYRIG